MEDKFEITFEVKDNAIKVYINGLIHLSFKQSELLGIQSWLIGEAIPTYCIELTFKDNIILAEYDTFSKWAKILKSLDSQPIFVTKFTS